MPCFAMPCHLVHDLREKSNGIVGLAAEQVHPSIHSCGLRRHPLPLPMLLQLAGLDHGTPRAKSKQACFSYGEHSNKAFFQLRAN